MTARSRRKRPIELTVGLILGLLVLGIAYLGPAFAPHSPSEILGAPFAHNSHTGVLGNDFLGRDALSRVLWGGRLVVTLAVAATLLGYLIGIAGGLMSAYRGGIASALFMRSVDVLLGIPPLLLLLVVMSGAGRNLGALVVAVAVDQVPSIARIVYSATLEQSKRGYVEAALSRGEHSSAIVVREIVPNLARPLLADAGLRLTWSILLIAAASFLGLGVSPPAADWALMVAENRAGLSFQPLPVIVPALLIALLTIAVNMVADGIGRSFGISSDEPIRR